VHDRVARLFAGVGVVAGSAPADELTETQLKLQALLAAIVRP
jgi:menaquinone-specific isochorismate synthase